jgi:hypothetical protein
VELYGVGYRNGYDEGSYEQCSPMGSNASGERNAFAAGWSTNGVLVDVGNNVGKTNAAFPRFEVVPFAVGQTTNAAPGELVPAGAKITFDLNLADPFVLSYLQSGLDRGRLRFMVSSLHTSEGQTGAPSYPDFTTRFNEAVPESTRLELEGVVVGSGDLDADGLADDWELFSLQSLTHNGSADVDGDRAPNQSELRAGTDPLDEESCLRVVSVTPDAEGHPMVRVPYAASRQYTVEFSDSLDGWTDLTASPVFELSEGVACWSDPEPSAARFYRVRAE